MLPRVAVGSTSCETQAACIGEDRLWMIRLSWAEMNGIDLSSGNFCEPVRQVPGLVVSDSKGLFDAFHRESAGLGMKEARSGMELLSLKETR